MAKFVDAKLPGFKIDDLINKDGITFDIGEQYCEENDEEFAYTPLVQYSNEEMLDMLNMNDFDDPEELNDDNEKGLSLYSISFAKLKTKMTNLTPDGKVMKYIKQKGTGKGVPDNAQVTVHYIGYFEYRDEPFDSSYSSGKPRVLRLNEANIIPGLHMSICSMQKHEIAVFLIHPDLAYKTFGCPPRIPPNEEVVFIVHLIDYLDNGLANMYETLSLEEKAKFECVVESVKHMLVSAKDNFAKFNVKAAIRDYKKAIDRLETVELKNDKEEVEMNQFLSRAYTNLGICYNKLDMPRSACMSCIRVPIPTAKTHYNYAKALLNLAEYDEAMKELQKGHKLDPSNDAIRKLIQQTNTKQRQYLEIEKRLWKNCFKSKEEQMKVSEFRKAVRDLCQTIINNTDIMRQPLPEGFTEEEHQIIREEAAILGLDVLTHSRYGKNTVYLQKSKA
ncbi:Peptidyl-prolyl cis-trans isomerase FKBP6 [Ooceraea biroi]|uniref:peptidylprolyl isomerase n=1 Tax=Ooceraea biroi TaxID=2015173 RepID=A0A026X467_OOCBI|nr:Peptidyl-prolyl cis-trans isomerase FKBP6 [Ooceraea biroi]